jgi:hypothetical protein
MARSGQTDFTVTANTIVTRAIAICSERSSEIPLDNNEITDGLVVLNMYVKFLMSEGLHLWTREEGVLFLREGVNEYTVGPNGDQATTLADFVNTDITTAAVSTATTLVVTSTTGMTALDNIGIELDDGTRQWTTIVSVDSPTGLTITAALTDDVAIGKTVFTYTSIIERPVKVEAARRASTSGTTEVELDKWSRQEYMAQTDKTSQGTPVTFFYSPQLDDGKFYVWQTANNVNQYLKFTYQRTIENFDTSANNPDFPIEWALPLTWNVAAMLGYEYDTPLAKVQMIEAKAMLLQQQILGFDEELTSLNIQPDLT